MENKNFEINENTNSIARVVIVGRQNVGKSALFNRIAPKVRALVYNEEGVTRDILKDICEWNETRFEIIDTAGFAFDKNSNKDEILEKSLNEVKNIINSADIFLFLIDGDIGFINEDRRILSYVQKTNVPCLFVINKSDKKQSLETMQMLSENEFKDPLLISATHGKGIEDLLNKITEKIKNISNFKNKIEIEDTRVRVSFLGRPNVGKSSLLNALLKKDRSIVSPIAGTTREAIEETINTNDFSFTIYDTAGVRKKRTINDRLEELMVSNTMKAVERSHIIIMVFDINEKTLFDQDIQLAMHSFYELYKAVLIVWNKTDLPEEDIQKKIKDITVKYTHFFNVVPQVFVSAKTEKNINRIIPEIENLWKRYSQFFESSEIKYLIKTTLSKAILIRNEQKLVIKTASVIRSYPPTIAIKTNQPPFFGESQLAFLTRKLRSNYNLLGVPIKWIVEKA